MLAHATSPGDWLVVLPVVLCLAGAALLLALRRLPDAQAPVAGAIVLGAAICDGVLLNRVLQSGPVAMTMGNWPPPFGISFAVDAVGAGVALAGAVVAFGVLLFAQADTPEGAVRDGFYPLLLLLLAGASGAVLTGDLFNLYVWFEVMLIAAASLIALAGNPLQLDGAVKYGVLNIVATALLLAAIGLFYGLVGTLNMADAIGAAQKADPAALAAVVALLALALGMKAAVFPLSGWLPASYHTPPATISALLGALPTKVGVYALLRVLLMVVPGAGSWLAGAFAVVAGLTMILGPLAALGETNPRRAIGFVLIGGVGVALSALGGPHSPQIAGAVAYLPHAMLTIAGLYMAVGLIERGTAVGVEGGLREARPLLAALTFVLVLAIAGVPPFLGFWPKLLLLEGFLADANWGLVFALLINALLTLVAGMRLWSRYFWQLPGGSGARRDGIGGLVLIAGTVVLLGLAPGLLLRIGLEGAQGLLDPARYIASVGLAP